ncbi:pyridoxal-dependent decarboxylase [Phyllobacterium sp. 22552]|uniref:pyridoxal-dependent decarboxylase n=1 Tax=Phyllobacterium sp. 22552 TaxID=3453941 RepID=UPI003F854D85
MNAMFVDSTARIENDMEITKLITDRLQRIHDGKASVTIEQDPFNQNLASYDFLTPRDLISVSEFVADATAFGTVPMTNPRYFGLFNPAPTYAAECADRIVAAFNPQLAVWTHAPAAVDIERHTVTAISTRLGFPEGAGGHFTVGGSEANETAVLCALTRANRQFSAQGARAYTGQPTLYVSRESHLAWFKIAHVGPPSRTPNPRRSFRPGRT